MSVTVHAVLFNHTPGDIRSGALNVRRNFRRPAILPEWQPGMSAADSVAVYVNDAVDETQLMIHAELRSLTGAGTIEVRAVEVDSVFPLQLYLPLVPRAAWQAGIASAWLHAMYLAWSDWMLAGGNVLGEVVARQVKIGPNGSSGLVPFRLRNVRLRARGAGASSVLWRWQFRTAPGTPWVDAGLSAHTICAIASTPTRPWLTEPFTTTNTNLVWTDVLRFACTWARGVRSRAEAAKAITEAIYALGTESGGGLLEYGCVTGAPAMYAFPLFNLTAFLDRLEGGFGAGRFVNCTDCAAFVATFANALGCDFSVSRMRGAGQTFRCNPLLAIGSKRWQEPCGLPFGFTYHEVAWSGECGPSDLICDACAGFSGLTTVPPPGTVPRVPSNVRFADDYRNLIAAPEARASCSPRPAERVRRPFF